MEQNGIPGCVVISQATYDESHGFFDTEKLEPITLHEKPKKNVLPGDKTMQLMEAEQHAAAPPVVDEKTRVHRYRVIAHLGAMAPHREQDKTVVLFHPGKSGDPASGDSPAGGAGVVGRRSRPASANMHTEGDRALPPFVANILGRIQASNWRDVQLRLERSQAMLAAQREKNAPPALTAVATLPPRVSGDWNPRA